MDSILTQTTKGYKRMITNSQTWLSIEHTWIRTRGYHLGEPIGRQFNYDANCWNRYVKGQARTADRSGFPAIANNMLECLSTATNKC